MPLRPFVPGWSPQVAQRAMLNAARLGHYVSATFADDTRPLPASWSLAAFRRWTFDQGQVGSCFSNNTAQVAQILMTVGDASRAFQVSRWLIWYQGRKLDGSLGSGGDGGSITNAMLALTDAKNGIGCGHEALAPYQASHRYLERRPPDAAFDDAGHYRLTEMAQAQLGDPAKRLLYNGKPIAIGIWWPSAWDTMGGTFFGKDTIRRGSYGHALAIIGYATWNNTTWWQIENSHGAIYSPLPADHASTVPGYVPASPTATFDFWVDDETLTQVMSYQWTEMIAAAGPEGFSKQELTFGEAVMPIP